MTQPGGQAPPSSGGGSEVYNYDAGRDGYKPRNNYYDTLEELNLVRGVGDNFWGTFGEMFTVYGGCQINVGAIPPEKWPIMAAIIRYAAKDPTSPVLMDDLQVAAIAQKILSLMQMTGGAVVQNVTQLVNFINNPEQAMQNMATGNKDSSSGSSSASTTGQGALGIVLDNAKANQVMIMQARRIYRLDAVGTIQRTKDKKIQVHIRGIWDSEHVNQNTTSADPNDLKGTWVYWRQD